MCTTDLALKPTRCAVLNPRLDPAEFDNGYQQIVNASSIKDLLG
jgi:hypothetical protein